MSHDVLVFVFPNISFSLCVSLCVSLSVAVSVSLSPSFYFLGDRPFFSPSFLFVWIALVEELGDDGRWYVQLAVIWHWYLQLSICIMLSLKLLCPCSIYNNINLVLISLKAWYWCQHILALYAFLTRAILREYVYFVLYLCTEFVHVTGLTIYIADMTLKTLLILWEEFWNVIRTVAYDMTQFDHLDPDVPLCGWQDINIWLLTYQPPPPTAVWFCNNQYCEVQF